MAQIEGTDAGWFLTDALGSVRQIVDDNGDVVLVRDYSPYGQMSAESGTGSSGYGFTGEQFDASFDIIFLRARWYDGGTGRFLSQDPWPGSIYQPSTLHKYLYVLNNPTNRRDPSGKQPYIDPGHGGGCWTPPPPPPGSILTPREYVEQYKNLDYLVYPKTRAPEGNWEHGTLALKDLEDSRLPEHVLLAMTGLAESTGNTEGMEAVMWIVRTRVKFNWPEGESGFGTTYREQILAYGQFSEYNWLHPQSGKNAERPFMYAFDPKGRDSVGRSTQTFNWYKTAYQLALKVMASGYQQMPRKLRRLDSFVSDKYRQETIAKGQTDYVDFVINVGGNRFGNWMNDDNVFWDRHEGFYESGWQPR